MNTIYNFYLFKQSYLSAPVTRGFARLCRSAARPSREFSAAKKFWFGGGPREVESLLSQQGDISGSLRSG